MDYPSRASIVNLPIDFIDVGLLQARTYKPMGLVVLDKGIGISHSDLLEKIKTVALRQVVELQHVKPDDVVVFVRRIQVKPSNGKAEFDGYIGRCTMPSADDVKQFLQSTLVQNRPLQVELWNNNDPFSPSHFYWQRHQRPLNAPFSERDRACKVLEIEAKQLPYTSPGQVSPAAAGVKQKVLNFSVQILTDYDVRALRRDLARRISRLTGSNRNASDIDVFFERTTPAAGTDASKSVGEMSKSKHSFEDRAFACIAGARKMKIQYRIRPKFTGPSLTTAKPIPTPAVPVEEQPAAAAAQKNLPTVIVNDKRTADFFGGKPTFGLQPASTAPPPVTFPPIGSPFGQYVRSGPLRMSTAGSATSFKTLADGFNAAIAASAVSPAPATSAFHPTTSLGGRPFEEEEKAHFKAGLNAFKDQMCSKVKLPEEASEKAQKTSDADRKQTALKQVESMLTKFMVNLNQTLQANFGQEASTLSIFHEDQSQREAAPKPSAKKEEPAVKLEAKKAEQELSEAASAAPSVRHNAICDVCDHTIKGTRFKCQQCPDWDCCTSCRVKVDSVHPGHCFMTIKTLDVVASGVKPKSWVHHPGIYCDACSGPIWGPRFKCISCADYDLCANCESLPKKVHDQGDHHVFIKIDKPLVDSSRLPHFVWQAREVIDAMRQPRSRVQQSQVQSEEAAKVHFDMLQNHLRQGERPTVAVKEEEKTLSDILSASKGKEATDSLTVLVPDLYIETKKVKKGTEDGSSMSVKYNKATKDTLTDDDMKSVQERLTSLYVDAQKLPGAKTMLPESLMQTPTAEAVAASSSPIDEEEEDYDMEMITDVNMPDGTKVLAGTQFDKWWRVRNTGKKTWPTSALLRMTMCSSGNNTDKVVAPLTTAVKPQEIVEIGVTDLQAGEALGSQQFYFRMELPSMTMTEGKRFGQQLWTQVQVVDGRSLSNSSNTFTSARGEKEDTVDQWEHQGSSLGSSLFQLPRAPQSVAASSEAGTANIVSTADDEEDNISLASTEETLDDYEVIEPSDDEGSL